MTVSDREAVSDRVVVLLNEKVLVAVEDTLEVMVMDKESVVEDDFVGLLLPVWVMERVAVTESSVDKDGVATSDGVAV